MTEEVTQNTTDTPTCNTKRSRCWGPNTWNNYKPEDFELLKEFAKNECVDYALQEEVGESGTPHIQFALKFKNARTFKSLKKKFPEVHWERARSWDAAKTYCSKDDSRGGERVVFTEYVCRDPLQDVKLRDFQQEVLDIIEGDPDDRTIHWIYDEVGNMGKTSLAKHICLKYPGESIYVTGKSADIKYGVSQMVLNGRKNKKILKVVLLDFTRSIENFISYEGIESVKNGIFYNSKYESGMVLFDPPHVICMANFEPDYDKLSKDRWNVIEL